MRTVVAVAIAFALCGSLAGHAQANPSSDLSQLVGAFEHIQSVRVIEKFENGAVATVDVIPSGQFRIATTGGQDASLIMKIATQPVDGAVSTGAYNVTIAGKKTIDGARTTGYRIIAPDGTYDATVWVNEYHLPVTAHVITQGHSIDVIYGDYNNSARIARP
jgi:hypothetical protein